MTLKIKSPQQISNIQKELTNGIKDRKLSRIVKVGLENESTCKVNVVAKWINVGS
jgi:hypothetical protein